MTVLLTIALPTLIVMAADSAITCEFGSGHPEYVEKSKSYLLRGIGGVTTWGAMDGNQIGPFLWKQNLVPGTHSIDFLADRVETYLRETYRPDERGTEDVGFHVAGFDSSGCPKVYHIFWGFDRPRPPQQKRPEYKRYPHHLVPGIPVFLYNGRNELAETVVHTFWDQVAQGQRTRYDLKTPVGLVRFADLVMRFAAEITPEVGPPFQIHVFGPDNVAKTITNCRFSPLDPEKVSAKLG